MVVTDDDTCRSDLQRPNAYCISLCMIMIIDQHRDHSKGYLAQSLSDNLNEPL